MRSHDRSALLHRALNIILSILYIPWAFMCSLAGLVQDGLVNETNVFLLISGQIVTWSGIVVALTSHYCLYLSDKAYSKGRKCDSYVIRFLPIIVMVAAFLIFTLACELAEA